jgi:hypothetical protein
VILVLSLIGVRLYRLPLIAHSGMPAIAGIACGTWSDSNWPQSNGEIILPDRTTLTNITFLRPFLLTDIDGVQPAGTYTVETIDTTLDNLSFIAYRRVSTSIMLPAVGVVARQRQVIFIDPLELEAAVKRDAQI